MRLCSSRRGSRIPERRRARSCFRRPGRSSGRPAMRWRRSRRRPAPCRFSFRSARWASSLARDWQLHPGMRCPLCKSRRLCAAGRMQSLRCPSLCVRWPMTRSAAQRRTSAGISLTARARSILTASGRIQSLRRRRQSRRSAMPRFPVFREKRSHTPILRPAMLSATTAQKGRSTPAFDS